MNKKRFELELERLIELPRDPDELEYEDLFALCLSVTIVGTFADEFDKIIESKNSNDGLGNYEFQFLTADGISGWQTGRLQHSGNKTYIYVEGGYSYLDHTQGVERVVTFVADQNGFRPTLSQEPIGPPPLQPYPSRFGSGATGK